MGGGWAGVRGMVHDGSLSQAEVLLAIIFASGLLFNVTQTKFHTHMQQTTRIQLIVHS